MPAGEKNDGPWRTESEVEFVSRQEFLQILARQARQRDRARGCPGFWTWECSCLVPPKRGEKCPPLTEARVEEQARLAKEGPGVETRTRYHMRGVWSAEEWEA